MHLEFKINNLNKQIDNFVSFSRLKDQEIKKEDAERNRLNIKIERYAQKVIENLEIGETDKKTLLETLQNGRLKLSRAVAAYEYESLKPTHFATRLNVYGRAFNPQPMIPSSLISPIFQGGRFISQTCSPYAYDCPSPHFRSSTLLDFRLSSEAIHYLPQEIVDLLGNVEEKEVDLFFSVFNASDIPQVPGQHLNLSLHNWAHRHELNQCDIQTLVEVGMFHSLGFYPHASEQEKAGFGFLHPQIVHTHPKEGTMATSPNNMRFYAGLNEPFGTSWVVAKSENRILIIKMLLLFSYVISDHDQDQTIAHFFGPSISGHEQLFRQEIASFFENKYESLKVFEPLLKQIQNKDPQFIETFKSLPSSFKEIVYHRVWEKKDGLDIPNFGNRSFEANADLDSKFHCSWEERLSEIETLKFQLELTLPEPRIAGDEICAPITMMKPNLNSLSHCIDLFENQIPQSIHSFFDPLMNEMDEGKWSEHFNKLPYAFREEIRNNGSFSTGALEEKKRGVALFVEKLQKTLSLEPVQLLKATPLPLANSVYPLMKCAQYFLEDNVEDAITSFNDLAPHLQNAIYFAMWELIECVREDHAGKRAILDPTISNFKKARAVLIAASRQKGNYRIEERKSYTTERLKEKMLKVLALEEFKALIPQERVKILDCYLNQDISLRNRVHGQAYHLSSDSSKGGDGWGAFHYADDLDLLCQILNER